MLSIFGYNLEREMVQLRSELSIRPGSYVGEIGGGDGEAALSMARAVGPLGKVYVTELEPPKVMSMMRRFRREHVSNATVLLSGHDSCNLPPLSCDVIFMRTSYHHLTRPGEFLHSVYEALRPDGLAAVIDFTPSRWLRPFAPAGVPKDRGGHGIPVRILEREMEEAGFARRQKIDPWVRGRFCYIFYKADYLSSFGRDLDKGQLS